MAYGKLSPGTLDLCFGGRPPCGGGPARRWQAAPNPSAVTVFGVESIRGAAAESRSSCPSRAAAWLAAWHDDPRPEGVYGEAVRVSGDVRAGAPRPGAAHHRHGQTRAAAALLPGRPAGPAGGLEAVRGVAPAGAGAAAPRAGDGRAPGDGHGPRRRAGMGRVSDPVRRVRAGRRGPDLSPRGVAPRAWCPTPR